MTLEKKAILTALGRMRSDTTPRKFNQSVELAVNFRGVDFKKAENRIDVLVTMPHSTGKGTAKVALFAKDSGFAGQVKGLVTRVIMEEEISQMDKKTVAKLAEEYDAFLAEGATMLAVGKYLGQILAPKGKMPRPVPAEVSAVEQALRTIKSGIRVTNKKGKFMPVVHIMVGHEKMSDNELAENIHSVYTAIMPAINGQEANIKNMYIKMTMGPPTRIGGGPATVEGGKTA